MGNTFSCKICFRTKCKWNQFEKNERCGHNSFCKECIAKYIISKVDTEDVSNVECPEFGCNEPLDAASSKRLLSKPKYARWHRTILEFNKKNRAARLRGLVGRKDDIDVNFATFAVSKDLQQCPNCNFFVERRYGCSYVRCRCGVEFCYQCGGQTQNHAHSGGACHKRVAILFK